MAYHTFPWNMWIDSLMRGEPGLFLEGLQRAVFGSAFFRGKTDSEIYLQYGGVSQDDIVQNVWLELVERKVIFTYKDAGLSDDEIGGRIVNKIRTRIIDAARRARRRAATFSPADTEKDYLRTVSDRGPSPEENLMNQVLINSILAQLTPRQSIILKNYDKFGSGEMQREQLAHKFHISVQMIDKEIANIKRKVRAIAEDWGLNAT